MAKSGSPSRPNHLNRRPLKIQDGNRAPIPDPQQGIHPLGDENEANFVPPGSLAGENPARSGEAGAGTFSRSPSPKLDRPR